MPSQPEPRPTPIAPASRSERRPIGSSPSRGRTPSHALGLLALVAILASASSASATGYGLYLDYGWGPVDGGVQGVGYDMGLTSVGFTLDSAVAKDKLFNYRMNLGYQYGRMRFNGEKFGAFNGGTFENVFGFGVYRDPRMRIWLGPSLRVATSVLDKSSVNVPVPGNYVRLTAGGGIAAGINWHTGNVGSVAFTIGYQYAYLGEFVTGGLPTDPYFHGRQQRVNFNFAYYFRGAGDRFD